MNSQATLQAHTRANKASKINQDIKMTDNATAQEDNTEEVQLPPNPHGLLGDPFPGNQATMKVYGHKPDSGDIGMNEFLIEGASNPPDLQGIEEEQLLQIQ